MGCYMIPEWMAAFLLGAAIFTSAASIVEAQNQQVGTTCASMLLPCSNYLNLTTTPPQACCGPLGFALKTQFACLCKLYDSPIVLRSFGVNVTKARLLPTRCNITNVSTTASACNKTSVSSPPKLTPAEPVTKHMNSGGRIAWEWRNYLGLIVGFMCLA